MSSRTRSYRPWLWSAALFLSAGPVAAQPPSPVELVRGLRENGQFDLALEYLKEIESKVTTPDDKAAIGLERAKCLLEAAEEESEESTRVGMVALAKEGLNTFLTAAPNHPRRVEGLLAQAKLTTLDAREQLNKARRIDIPPASEDKDEMKAREAAQEKQKAESQKARPLFLLASRRYAEASELLRTKLGDAALDANTRRTLQQEAFDADLASGINQFNTAETFMPVSRITTAEKEERNKYLEAAKETFAKLDKGPANNRAVWTARAWIAEVTYEQNDFKVAAAQVEAILKATVLEARDGKRLAQFFALRRNFIDALSERVLPKVLASEKEIRDWLKTYGRTPKPTNEVYAVKFYLARILQSLAEASLVVPKPKDGKEPKTPPPPPTISNQARNQFTEAERIYRELTQSEHDYTARASRYRMQVVRRLIGEGDQPLTSFETFERAQMAALIQLSKLAQEEAKDEPDQNKVKHARLSAIALLERARDLAGPSDSPADVTAALLLLIYTYQVADQPYQAATLGDYAAHTLKGTGGKASVAGLLGLNGYYASSKRLRIDASLTDEEIAARTAARGVDRARAIALAKFLDEKYPNDNATDAARYRLASLFTEDQRYPEAFEAIIKVRPAYAQIASVRLLEGYLAAEIVRSKDTPPEKKVEVFRRAVTDLAKAVKPVPVALEEEVRTYVSARCRLATLLFTQGRVDPEREKTTPGYNQALEIGNEVFALIPTFDRMTTLQGGAKKLNLDGLEMTMLALDVRSRAVYLRARALIDAGQIEEAAKSIDPAIADINATGPAVTAEMKAWGTEGDDKDAAQKSKVRKLAEQVDKTRVEVILAGFRLRVRQGKAKEGEDLLNLMVKIGGSLEENLPLLEALGRESAAKMLSFQREGKTKEAEEIGAGLAVLLKKITEVPTLSPAQRLFVGQMLVPVKEYDKAIETLKKVPEPEYKEWRTTDPTRLRSDLAGAKKKLEAAEDPAQKGKSKDDPAALHKEIAEMEKKLAALPMGIEQRHPSQMHAYSVAQLTIGKALREAKRFSEAEKHLLEIIGTQDKQGWGWGRLYFRKELAAVYEDRGASVTGTTPADLKAANGEWGKALQIWTTLWSIHRNRLQKLPQEPEPMPDANATEDVKQAWADKEKRRLEELRQAKNTFAEAYFEIQRCLIKANQQLLKGQPPKLQKTMEDVAKRCFDMETKVLPQGKDWDAEVQHRYVDLIKETPALLKAYQDAGGKFFLEKRAVDE